jgi:hypothetical protein
MGPLCENVVGAAAPASGYYRTGIKAEISRRRQYKVPEPSQTSVFNKSHGPAWELDHDPLENAGSLRTSKVNC